MPVKVPYPVVCVSSAPGVFLCFLLVSLILQDFFEGLLLGRLFAFLCAGCGFPYPVADVPQLLQIFLHLGQRYFQVCDFVPQASPVPAKAPFSCCPYHPGAWQGRHWLSQTGQPPGVPAEFFLSFLEKISSGISHKRAYIPYSPSGRQG